MRHRSATDGKPTSLEVGDISLSLELVSEENGKRTYRMAGAQCGNRSLPGLPILLSAMIFQPAPQERAAPMDVEPEAGDEDEFKVFGTASSTSVDWYGTEMDRNALESMSRQFSAGVSLTPRHNSWYEAVEWDEVIGMTTSGVVRASNVANPADPSEQGYCLDIEATLFPKEEKAMNLHRRLKAKQPIGLSIGGWFTDVRFVTDEEDDVERMIILAVTLDHLAVTRSPANPDSSGLRLLRSLSQKAVNAIRLQRSAGICPPQGKEPEKVASPTSPEQDARGIEAPEDENMDPKEIARIAAEAAAAVYEARTAAAAAGSVAPAAPPIAPTETDTEARARALEAENAALRAKVRDLAGRSSERRTMAASFRPGKGEGSELRSLAQRARDEGFTSLSAVIQRNEEVLAGDDLQDPKITRPQLERSLRDLIGASIEDGLIGGNSAAWN